MPPRPSGRRRRPTLASCERDLLAIGSAVLASGLLATSAATAQSVDSVHLRARFSQVGADVCEKTAAPQLVGLTGQTALRKLLAAGFTGNLTGYSLSAKQGQIIGQFPRAGKDVCKDAFVMFDVYVHREPQG